MVYRTAFTVMETTITTGQLISRLVVCVCLRTGCTVYTVVVCFCVRPWGDIYACINGLILGKSWLSKIYADPYLSLITWSYFTSCCFLTRRQCQKKQDCFQTSALRLEKGWFGCCTNDTYSFCQLSYNKSLFLPYLSSRIQCMWLQIENGSACTWIHHI